MKDSLVNPMERLDLEVEFPTVGLVAWMLAPGLPDLHARSIILLFSM